MRKENDTNKMLRIMLRNQRTIMLTLANLSLHTGGSGSGYFSNRLTSQVDQMEKEWEWIAEPSARRVKCET